MLIALIDQAERCIGVVHIIEQLIPCLSCKRTRQQTITALAQTRIMCFPCMTSGSCSCGNFDTL